MKKNLFLLLTFISFLSACNLSAPKEEETTPKIYNCKEIGWTIEIPKGFQSLSKNRMEANAEKGKAAIGKVTEGEIKTDGLKHLVNFQKNQFNSLNATIEAYKEKQDGDYIKNNQTVKKLIFDAYASQKIKIDTVSGKEMIAGYLFNRFDIKIYGPNHEVLINQIMFNQLIKGYDFGVNINYNNNVDKESLIRAFEKSKFDQ